jgi:tetratricopeptide (TPR) repeat protein
MGDIYEKMGQTEEAFNQYLSSLKIFERLLVEEPNNDWIPWNCAVSFDHLGSMSHEFRGDAVAALDYYQKSLAHRQALAARPPTKELPASQRNLAVSVCYMRLAELTKDLGDPAKAGEYAKKALELLDDLLAANPKDGQVALFQMMCCYHLGRANAHLGDVAAARKYLQRCLDAREKAVKDEPTNATAKRDLGAAYDALGDMEVEQHQGPAALEAYRQANQLYDKLCQKEQNNAFNQWYLGGSFYRLGTAYELMGDTGAARKQFAESLKWRDRLVKTDPHSVQLQTERMLAQARCGQHVEASKAAGEISKRAAKKNAGVLYSAACGYALCAAAVAEGKSTRSAEDESLKRRYRELAVETLEQARAIGFRDREALRLDPNLAPVRNAERFEALLASLPKS